MKLHCCLWRSLVCTPEDVTGKWKQNISTLLIYIFLKALKQLKGNKTVKVMRKLSKNKVSCLHASKSTLMFTPVSM